MPSESALIIWHLTIFDALALGFAIRREANLSRFSFSSVMRRCKRPNGTSDAGRTSEKRSMTGSKSHPQAIRRENPAGVLRDNPVYESVMMRKTATVFWSVGLFSQDALVPIQKDIVIDPDDLEFSGKVLQLI